MHHRVYHFHGHLFKWRTIFTEEILAVFLAVLVFVMPLSAVPMRFDDRALFMKSTLPGATTSYTISMQHMTPESPIGSIDLLFCIDPIPYMACVTPPGLDVSGATLSSQTGETGFSIQAKSSNRIVISRPATPINPLEGVSSYTFDNIKNPQGSGKSFAIRMKSLASTNGTGQQIDFGSVKGQVTEGIVLQTQVPPMLIFCAAGEVSDDCSTNNDNFFTDMGQMGANTTLTAKSQLAVGTNASGGFAIVTYGLPPTAGTNVMQSPDSPTESNPGTNQFGINLVENNELNIGNDPEGDWANAIPATNYGQANRYMYAEGDTIAYSPNVSLMKKFTVSYILNTSNTMRAGVYTTTINYVASGRF